MYIYIGVCITSCYLISSSFQLSMCFSIFRGCHLVDLWLLEGFLVGEPRLGGGTGDPLWAPQRWIGYGAPELAKLVQNSNNYIYN